MSKQCFVIGPFGEERSGIRLWSDSLLREVIEPLAREFGYDAKRSIDLARPRDITSDLVGRLLQADLVIADLTLANANVYYELAIRHAIERPFIHIIQDGQFPPFDISNLDVLRIPVRRKFAGPVLPEPRPSLLRLRPYFVAVADGTASYASILSGQRIAKTLNDAIGEIESRRVAQHRELQLLKSSLPLHVQRAIFRYAIGSPVYYSRFDYVIDLNHVYRAVEYTMNVNFDLTNVSDHPQTVVNSYPTTKENFEVHAASIGGESVDLHDPNNYSGAALNLRHVIAPSATCTVAVTMMKRFSEQDTDLFTAYLYPADRFSFRVTNRSKGTLQMWLEMLNNHGSQAIRSGDTLEWRASDPILPNQGVRLLWRPTS